mmetsp:Transcript_102245/g.305246  ORF Transcript_102245/g.305246 Transcript_102245/m.305246 type:complete len:262 (+) Transcript_102245:710-1495(+)
MELSWVTSQASSTTCVWSYLRGLSKRASRPRSRSDPDASAAANTGGSSLNPARHRASAGVAPATTTQSKMPRCFASLSKSSQPRMESPDFLGLSSFTRVPNWTARPPWLASRASSRQPPAREDMPGCPMYLAKSSPPRAVSPLEAPPALRAPDSALMTPCFPAHGFKCPEASKADNSGLTCVSATGTWKNGAPWLTCKPLHVPTCRVPARPPAPRPISKRLTDKPSTPLPVRSRHAHALPAAPAPIIATFMARRGFCLSLP